MHNVPVPVPVPVSIFVCTLLLFNFFLCSFFHFHFTQSVFANSMFKPSLQNISVFIFLNCCNMLKWQCQHEKWWIRGLLHFVRFEVKICGVYIMVSMLGSKGMQYSFLQLLCSTQNDQDLLVSQYLYVYWCNVLEVERNQTRNASIDKKENIHSK